MICTTYGVVQNGGVVICSGCPVCEQFERTGAPGAILGHSCLCSAVPLNLPPALHYTSVVQNPKLARPNVLYLRIAKTEQEAFASMARVYGIQISVWARYQLRLAAAMELNRAGLPVPFLDNGEVKG